MGPGLWEEVPINHSLLPIPYYRPLAFSLYELGWLENSPNKKIEFILLIFLKLEQSALS